MGEGGADGRLGEKGITKICTKLASFSSSSSVKTDSGFSVLARNVLERQTSVTRIGEISPLWLSVKSLLVIFYA